jgi:hypothetical protein
VAAPYRAYTVGSIKITNASRAAFSCDRNLLRRLSVPLGDRYYTRRFLVVRAAQAFVPSCFRVSRMGAGKDFEMNPAAAGLAFTKTCHLAQEGTAPARRRGRKRAKLRRRWRFPVVAHLANRAVHAQTVNMYARVNTKHRARLGRQLTPRMAKWQ